MMKKKLAKRYTNNFFIKLVLVLLLQACSPKADVLYEKSIGETKDGHFRVAVDLLIHSAEVEKKNQTKYKYLFEAARLVRFEIQDYGRSLKILRQIILGAEEANQRLQAQEALTEILIENQLDYALGLKELQKLEPLLTDTKQKEKTKLKIAQTLYLTGQLQLALEEILANEKNITNFESNFLKLKAEIFLAQKKYKESITAYDDIKKRDPVYFATENLFIATSIVYEENEQYSEALNYLNKNEKQIKDKAYFELRTKRLIERLANKPLFKGVRK